MPARIKSESADVDGNQFIVSGADHNRHDSEIRALQKVIGVPSLPVSGFSGATNACSMVNVLLQVLNQIKALRDDFIQQTSGVVAVEDEEVTGVDGIIPFPAAWSNTTLESEIPDASITDEENIAPLSSITLADVSGMPDEGYITIINDVSTAPVFVFHNPTLQVVSPTIAYAKVGADFLYEVLANKDATFTVQNLPAGLTFDGALITGQPTTAAKSTIVVTANSSNPTETATFSLGLTVSAAATPTITSPLVALGTVGSPFNYQIGYTGVLNAVTFSNLPGGFSTYGAFLSGTPRETGTYNILMSITDAFGGLDSQTLVLTVS